MSTSSPTPLRLLVVLALAACPPMDLGDFPPVCDPNTETCPPTTGASDTEGPASSTTPTDGIQTVTGPPTDSSSGEPGEMTGTSTGAPSEAPEIVDVDFDPSPLKHAGPIAVTVQTKGASAVEMKLEDGTIQTLTPGDRDSFTGAIEVLTGTQNGTHTAIFTPSAGEAVGDADPRPYEVGLPEPGTGAWWDASPDLGKGEVRAVRATSTLLYELGTRQEDGTTHCYLRRRDLFGKYSDGDVMTVLPGKTCVATDLAVGPAEEIYVLANVTIAGQTRWWSGHVTAWEQTTKLDEGGVGEIAGALTVAPDGAVVACGAAPSPQKDLDAQYWLAYSGGFGKTHAFDYWPAKFEPHTFVDTIADCEFAGDTLVMVGEAFGKHDKDDPLMVKRRRLALVEVDLTTDAATWTVAEAGPGDLTQSSGTSVAIDDAGNAIVGLYVSKDKGGVLGEVRIFAPGGALVELPLTLANDILPPTAVAWNPAGYFVFASARDLGVGSEFLVGAYFPGKPTPIWTYFTSEGVGPNLARALTFVPGVVVAGGISGAGFPALAFIYG